MFITRFLPPSIRRGLRAFRAAFPEPIPPFEGVFASFAESKPTLAEFDKEWWKSRCKKAVEDARALTATAFPSSAPPHWLLPFLIGTMPKGKIRILDFGGGGGLDYIYASKLSSRGDDLDYHVVDVPAACEAGRELADLPVTFHLDPPPDDQHFDVVYASNSIQYVEDYRALLAKFSGYGPKYILICKTSIHSGSQFVRAQTNIGGRTPAWVFSLSNIDAALPDYEREFCAKSDDLYPMHTYPDESRVPWMTNLLYVRRHE